MTLTPENKKEILEGYMEESKEQIENLETVLKKFQIDPVSNADEILQIKGGIASMTLVTEWIVSGAKQEGIEL